MASAELAPPRAGGAPQTNGVDNDRDSYNKQSFGPALNARVKQVCYIFESLDCHMALSQALWEFDFTSSLYALHDYG
jgi:hypothetical protein